MTKYSIKNICLGIGIGLILSSMANIGTAPKTLSVDEIRREAAKHNLIVMDEKAIINKEPEVEKQNQEKDKSEEQKSSLQIETQQQEQPIIVTVKSGTKLKDIAELLLTNKLITNKNVFLDRLAQRKQDSKMQIGVFKIPAGSSIDSIIDIITTSPK
jgi:hypothetical protein